MTTGIPWTADDDARLRAGWPTESISVIGEALGRSRSAVIGRAGRLGLPYKPTPSVVLPRPAPAPRRLPPGLPALPVAAGPPQSTARKRLLDLALFDCHWPIGDPRDRDFGFCAAPALRPFGYCPHHQRMNYGR